MIINPCSNCYLSVKSNKITGTEGVGKRSIVFINDASTPSDIKSKIPFSGKSDKIIRQFIDRYDMESYVYLTNLIKCETPNPNDYYAQKCLPYLIKEIHDIQPKIIVTVGGLVYRNITDEKPYSISSIVNKPKLFAKKIILIPIYAPAYIVKNKSYDEYYKSFDLIAKILNEFEKYYINPFKE